MPAWLRLLFAIPIIGGLAIWLWFHVFTGIIRGKARHSSSAVRRREQPVLFWIVIAVHALFASASTWAMVRVVSESLP